MLSKAKALFVIGMAILILAACTARNTNQIDKSDRIRLDRFSEDFNERWLELKEQMRFFITDGDGYVYSPADVLIEMSDKELAKLSLVEDHAALHTMWLSLSDDEKLRVPAQRQAMIEDATQSLRSAGYTFTPEGYIISPGIADRPPVRFEVDGQEVSGFELLQTITAEDVALFTSEVRRYLYETLSDAETAKLDSSIIKALRQ